MNNYNDAPKPLFEYLNYLSTIKFRSELTILNYYTDLKLFFRFLKRKHGLVDKDMDFSEINISDVTVELIQKVTLNDAMEFLHFTSKERGNNPKARARKAVSLRQFFKYLTDKKELFLKSPMDKLELPSPKSALPKYLSLNECELLLNSLSAPETWSDYRDYCMIVWFLNCGMRLSELVGVNMNDVRKSVDFSTEGDVYLLKVLGKGDKERILYLNNACVIAWQNYLEHRPEIKHEKALFVSRNSKRISNRRVEQIIDNKIKLAGLDGKDISVHKLRHTAATLMYQNGVDVRVLKDVLGHQNLNTTQIYTHVANKQMQQAMNQNPLANKTGDNKKDK